MSTSVAQLSKTVYDRVLGSNENRNSSVSTTTSWRLILGCSVGLWILFNIIQTPLVDFWFNINFKEPWTASDYPPLRSDNSGELVPWIRWDYPALRRPDSNIRLLKLNPGSRISGLEATLKSHSFLERPQYKALSYAWEDTNKTKPITINGKKMMIDGNLWNALYYLRDSGQSQTFWINAICIDQSNNVEKGI